MNILSLCWSLCLFPARYGAVVKWLRRYSFTVESRVRLPPASPYGRVLFLPPKIRFYSLIGQNVGLSRLWQGFDPPQNRHIILRVREAVSRQPHKLEMGSSTLPPRNQFKTPTAKRKIKLFIIYTSLMHLKCIAILQFGVLFRGCSRIGIGDCLSEFIRYIVN